jgi:hypothetical protein
MSDSGEFNPNARRAAQAASVSNRWWESGSAHPGVGRPGADPTPPLWQAPPPPPPPPPPPRANAIGLTPRAATETGILLTPRDRHHLELELEAARAEIDALHEMLEDLPEIFERKFRQRVQGLVEDQQRLLSDNQLLRDRLYALTPATPTAPALLAAAPPPSRAPGLRQSLREALRSLRRRSGAQPTPMATILNPPDDERTTAA